MSQITHEPHTPNDLKTFMTSDAVKLDNYYQRSRKACNPKNPKNLSLRLNVLGFLEFR
jgi:hypothetical protein